MTELEQKAAFAVELLKTPADPFRAALAVFNGETKPAFHAATYWVNDPHVKAIQDELVKEEGELAYLPTKGELCRAVWDRMNKPSTDAMDFARLAKVYAEVRGFIDKPGMVVNNNSTIDNRVLVVKDMGTDAEWEMKAERQQRALVNVADSRH